jgi:integrase
MILFGFYIGQRLADVATLQWSNVDLVKGEIRLRTRKTDKVMILPIAAPLLRRYLEGLSSSDDMSLRRTATTLLHEAGVPAAVVQSLIGHDSEEVHQLYVAVGKDALASAAAKLPDLT